MKLAIFVIYFVFPLCIIHFWCRATSVRVDGNFSEEIRAGGRIEDNHLQRDAVVNVKAADENRNITYINKK